MFQNSTRLNDLSTSNHSVDRPQFCDVGALAPPDRPRQPVSHPPSGERDRFRWLGCGLKSVQSGGYVLVPGPDQRLSSLHSGGRRR